MRTLLLAATLVTALASAQAEEAAAAARAFCALNLTSPVSGLPSPAQMKEYSPLLSAEIIRLIEQARNEQQVFARQNPGEKPPWIEGALFSSLFEGVSDFRLGDGVTSGDKVSAPVYWRYAADGQVSEWIDVLVLENRDGRWKVCDIFFCAPWDFRPGPSLRAHLKPDPSP